MIKKFNVTVNGNSYEVEVEEIKNGEVESSRVVSAPMPRETSSTVPKQVEKPVPIVASGDTVTAPMPGTILDVKVAAGNSVKKGDIIIVLEAMKMENEILAPADGTIVAVNVAKGASVNTGDVLVTM